MRIYIVGLTVPSLLKYKVMFPTEQINVLLSFGRKDQDKWGFYVTHREKVNSIMLDSGAYTVNWSSRIPAHLTIERYIDYAVHYGQYVEFLFNLDSDFSVDGHYKDRINFQNQVLLEAAGLDPVPVIHDICRSEIRDYIGRGRHGMLAIGSSLLDDPIGMKIAIHRIHTARIKVHLFGTTKFELLATNPVSSCDASTWSQEATRGYILFWNPKRKGTSKTDHIQFTQYKKKLPGSHIRLEEYDFLGDLIDYLRNIFGFGLSDLQGKSGLLNRQIVNIHYFVKHQERINEEHRKRGFFARPDDTLM
ncbi:MAG: hypothetical protein ABSH41_01740 [Syntrophobacteraceae bacterium]